MNKLTAANSKSLNGIRGFCQEFDWVRKANMTIALFATGKVH